MMRAHGHENFIRGRWRGVLTLLSPSRAPAFKGPGKGLTKEFHPRNSLFEGAMCA